METENKLKVLDSTAPQTNKVFVLDITNRTSHRQEYNHNEENKVIEKHGSNDCEFSCVQLQVEHEDVSFIATVETIVKKIVINNNEIYLLNYFNPLIHRCVINIPIAKQEVQDFKIVTICHSKVRVVFIPENADKEQAKLYVK